MLAGHCGRPLNRNSTIADAAQVIPVDWHHESLLGTTGFAYGHKHRRPQATSLPVSNLSPPNGGNEAAVVCFLYTGNQLAGLQLAPGKNPGFVVRAGGETVCSFLVCCYTPLKPLTPIGGHIGQPLFAWWANGPFVLRIRGRVEYRHSRSSVRSAILLLLFLRISQRPDNTIPEIHVRVVLGAEISGIYF